MIKYIVKIALLLAVSGLVVLALGIVMAEKAKADQPQHLLDRSVFIVQATGRQSELEEENHYLRGKENQLLQGLIDKNSREWDRLQGEIEAAKQYMIDNPPAFVSASNERGVIRCWSDKTSGLSDVPERIGKCYIPGGKNIFSMPADHWELWLEVWDYNLVKIANAMAVINFESGFDPNACRATSKEGAKYRCVDGGYVQLNVVHMRPGESTYHFNQRRYDMEYSLRWMKTSFEQAKHGVCSTRKSTDSMVKCLARRHNNWNAKPYYRERAVQVAQYYRSIIL